MLQSSLCCMFVIMSGNNTDWSSCIVWMKSTWWLNHVMIGCCCRAFRAFRNSNLCSRLQSLPGANGWTMLNPWEFVCGYPCIQVWLGCHWKLAVLHCSYGAQTLSGVKKHAQMDANGMDQKSWNTKSPQSSLRCSELMKHTLKVGLRASLSFFHLWATPFFAGAVIDWQLSHFRAPIP